MEVATTARSLRLLAQIATPAKGEQLLTVAATGVVDFLTEFRTWKHGVSLRSQAR